MELLQDGIQLPGMDIKATGHINPLNVFTRHFI
jgi:hypothetical protein